MSIRFVVFIISAFFLLQSPAAQAKKGVYIKTIGIKSYDKVFKQARKIETQLASTERSIVKARKDLNTALGLKKTSNYVNSLAVMKKKAKGSIKMAKKGNVPSFSVSNASPAFIKKGIKALNSTCKHHVDSIKRLKKIIKEEKKLVDKAKKFPTQFKKEVINNPLMLITNFKKIRTIAKNVKHMVKLPVRTKDVIQKLTKSIKDITGAFGGAWSFLK